MAKFKHLIHVRTRNDRKCGVSRIWITPSGFSTLLIYDMLIRVSVGHTYGGLSHRIIIRGVEGDVEGG